MRYSILLSLICKESKFQIFNVSTYVEYPRQLGEAMTRQIATIAIYQSSGYLLAGSVFGFFLLLAGGSSRAQDSTSLVQQFLTEAPRDWDRFNSHTFQLQGRIRMVVKSKAVETIQGYWEIKDKPDHRLSVVHIKDLKNRTEEQSVYAYNPDYRFSLRRRSSDAPWILADWMVRQPGTNHKLLNAYNDEIGSGIQRSLLSVYAMRVDDLIRQPNFRAIRGETVSRDGQEWIQIDFTNQHILNDKGSFDPIQSGTLVFDPKQSWCLRGYEIRTKHSNSESVIRSDVIEVRESSVPRFPLPVRIAYTKTSLATEPGYVGQTVITSLDTQYEIQEPYSPADEEFRLSAFGLPEPQGVTWDRPTPRSVYLLAAAGGFALLAVVLRWLARRYRPSTTPT
jgi:hypothetical protein